MDLMGIARLILMMGACMAVAASTARAATIYADQVKLGTGHWSRASGDTADSNDADDFDNSFGDHAGAHSAYAANKAGVESFDAFAGDYISFDLATATAGDYTYSIDVGEGAGQAVRVEFLDKGRNVWVALSPDATNSTTGWV